MCCRRVKPQPVVVDFEDGLVAISMEAYPTGRRLSVLAHIRKRLPRQLHNIGRPGRKLGSDGAVDVGHSRDAALRLKLSGQVLERLLELAISEDSGTKAKDVIAQVTDRAVDLAHGGLDPRFHLGI